MDRLEALRAFVRIVEAGSFSKVARELNVGQPAISKQLSALERELGATLLRRSPRHLSVTQVGTELYESMARILPELEAALARAKHLDGAVSGILRVTVPPCFGRLYVVPHLAALRAQHPALTVELVVSEQHVNLVAENIDLAVRGGSLADSDLVARPLGRTPLYTLASARYLRKHGEPESLRDLEQHACIAFVARGAVRPFRFRKGNESITHLPRASFRSNDADQLRAAVLADLGIAQSPGWLFAEELARGTVRTVLSELAPSPLPLWAVRPAGEATRRVGVFTEFLRARFAAEPMLSWPAERGSLAPARVRRTPARSKR